MFKPASALDTCVKGGENLRFHNQTSELVSAEPIAGARGDRWYTELPNLASAAYGSLCDAPPLTGDALTGKQKEAIKALIGGQQAAARLSSSGKTWSTHLPVQTSLAPRKNLSHANLGPIPTSQVSALQYHRSKRGGSRVAKSFVGEPMDQERPAEGDDLHNPIEVDKEPEQVDMTGSPKPAPLHCDNCGHDGTHSTGRCAIVTAAKEGDCFVDPFCNGTCRASKDRNNNIMHALQGKQKHNSRNIHISCPRLATAYQQSQMVLLFTTFVLERRRMAPLLVYTSEFCFIRLTLYYAEWFCNKQMPPDMQGMWPYTRADAVKHQEELRHFYEYGLENMPKSELEGLDLSLIWQWYHDGAIEPQYRIPDKKFGPRPIKFA